MILTLQHEIDRLPETLNNWLMNWGLKLCVTLQSSFKSTAQKCCPLTFISLLYLKSVKNSCCHNIYLPIKLKWTKKLNFFSDRKPKTFDASITVIDDEDEESKFPSVRELYGHDENVYIMDAKTHGNIGRYLNVSVRIIMCYLK